MIKKVKINFESIEMMLFYWQSIAEREKVGESYLKKTTRKMRENLVWGADYNFIAIPLVSGILAPIGIWLIPAVGAILMSISTVIVAINAMMLKLDD